ncbi:MAG: VTT domain-containing protein [Oscillospiraceae bacterium]|nr:VTT domain-containing protein [Oscillospiraceae bacterium]
MSKGMITAVIKRIVQIAPIVMIGICALIYLKFFRGVTIEHILEFTPENLWLAALAMVGLFALKSLSVFFPMLILIAASGSIFPTFLSAFIVNCTGVAVMILIPYAIGRFAEREFVEGLINKNKNASKLRELKSDNELFIAYFLRVINILPCDLVSMFLGSAGFGLWKYMLGSFLGILPGIITTTLMGANVEHPSSPKFWLSVVTEFIFAAASSVWYYFYKKRKKNTANDIKTLSKK